MHGTTERTTSSDGVFASYGHEVHATDVLKGTAPDHVTVVRAGVSSEVLGAQDVLIEDGIPAGRIADGEYVLFLQPSAYQVVGHVQGVYRVVDGRLAATGSSPITGFAGLDLAGLRLALTRLG